MINPFKPHLYKVHRKLTFDGVDQYETIEVQARHSFNARLIVEEAGYKELRKLARQNPEADHTGLVTILDVQLVEEAAVAA